MKTEITRLTIEIDVSSIEMEVVVLEFLTNSAAAWDARAEGMVFKSTYTNGATGSKATITGAHVRDTRIRLEEAVAERERLNRRADAAFTPPTKPFTAQFHTPVLHEQAQTVLDSPFLAASQSTTKE